jgi:DNA-binding CsgD family transcriptional regulator
MLGLSFVLAWNSCVFLSPVVFSQGFEPLYSIENARFFFFAALIITFLIFAVFKKRMRELFDYRSARVAAPLLLFVGTALIVLGSYGNYPAAAALFLVRVSSFTAGIASSLFMLLWGCYYSSLPEKNSKTVIPLSVLLSVLYYLAITSVGQLLGTVLLFTLPLFSALTLWLGRINLAKDAGVEEKDISDSKTAALAQGDNSFDKDNSVNTKINIPWPSAIVTSLLWVSFGVMWAIWISTFMYVEAFERTTLVVVLSVAIALLALILFVVVFARQVDFTNVFWWAVPLIVIGFTFVPYVDSGWRILASCCIFMAKPMMEMQIWTHFASISGKGKASATQLFSVGLLALCFGELIGSIFGIIALTQSNGEGLLSISLVVVNIIVFSLLAMMFVVNRVKQEKRKETVLPQSSRAPHKDTCQKIAEQYKLTARETEILILLAKGRNRPYIEKALHISHNTINTHTRHIYEKMNIHSRQEFIDFFEVMKAENS